MIYGLLYGIARCLALIPYPAGRFLGRALGTAAALLPLGRKETVLENMQRALGPSTDRARAERLRRRVFVHFGQVLFEVPHIFRLKPENLDRYVVFSGVENIERALRKGRGAFALTAHFGNWELMSAAVGLRFGGTAVVARPMDFPPLEKLMGRLRSRFGAEIIPKQRAMRRVMAALRKNRTVGILLDQNVAWYEGVFVNFLGQWACTNKGLALMALKTGTPVVPLFSLRRPDGRYQVVFGEEVRLQVTGDKIRDLEEHTALFTGVIEEYVRRRPDHWFWFHRRWKTRNFCPLDPARRPGG